MGQPGSTGRQTGHTPRHVFLSYARADARYVRSLAGLLEKKQIPIWYDAHISASDRFSRVIEEKIEVSAALVVVMTPEAKASDMVEAEIHLARRRGVPLVPLLLRGDPFFITAALQYEDVRDGRPPGKQLIRRLKDFVAGTAGAAPDRTEAAHVSKPPATGRHWIGVVPNQAECFQQRAIAKDLQAAAAGGTAIVTQTTLAGLGGVGKTQLAAELANWAWSHGEADTLVWVNAGSAEAVVSGYARAGVDILGVDHDDPEAAAQRFLSWLAGTEQRWLVVLDDLANPGDLFGMWPPTRANGRVVVTTRRHDAAIVSRGRLLDVGVFTPTEAKEYLAHKFAATPDRLVEAGELAQDLGHLPLALSQAAAYIADREIDCATYRRRWVDRKRRLPEMGPDALPDDYPVPLALAWSLSVEAADQLTPAGLATPLLLVLSLLDPNRIPLAVITRPSVVDFLANHRTGGPHEVERTVDGETARDALTCLVRLSLATRTQTPDRSLVAVHALVQRATRERAPADQARQAISAAADALDALWPSPERDVEFGQILRTNAAVLREHADAALWQPGAHPVLFRAGHSLADAGLEDAAVAYFEQLVTDSDAYLGVDHPDTLTARHDVASAYLSAGRLTEAIARFEENLAERERVLGADDEGTLTTRHDLAYAYQLNGQLDLAIGQFEAVLADRHGVQGARHRDPLTTRRHLAGAYQQAGRLDEAVSLYQATLQDCARVLGPEDPDTLTCRSRLAGAYQAKGRIDEAIALFTSTLADRQRVLGQDRPETLSSRNDLAMAYHAAGRHDDAVKVAEAALADCERVLGTDHSLTGEVRDNLRAIRG